MIRWLIRRSPGGHVSCPPTLSDGDLTLVLVSSSSGDPARGRVPSVKYEMRRAGLRRAMGYIDLRIGSTEELLRIGGHIGYRVDPPFRGHRYAARSVKLILPIAHGLGVDPVIITCNTDNEASRRTCELAGGRFVGTATVPPDSEMFARGDRVKCRFAFGAADSPRDVSKTEEARPN